jgi:hypothetical protein
VTHFILDEGGGGGERECAREPRVDSGEGCEEKSLEGWENGVVGGGESSLVWD